MAAISGNAVIAIKTDPFEVDGGQQVSLQSVGVGVEGEAWQAVIRPVRYRGIFVQRLVVLQQQFASPEFAVTIQAQVTLEMTGVFVLWRDRNKIIKKVVVRDFGQ